MIIGSFSAPLVGNYSIQTLFHPKLNVMCSVSLLPILKER